ncbi:C2H2-type zinc finger protein [Candidatus Magnetominusculus xianensis]|nr:C2H2-type zinc finger protein [Candidatus Magnetominusculus xianensis]
MLECRPKDTPNGGFRENCPHCGVVFDSPDELFTHLFTFHSC